MAWAEASARKKRAVAARKKRAAQKKTARA